MTNIQQLSANSLAGKTLSQEDAHAILENKIDLMTLVNESHVVRKAVWKNEVTVHIINNAQNGSCPEDCNYCAQARTSEADIEKYPAKEKEEMINEAKRAYENGAHRYCMVFSGRAPSTKRVNYLCDIIKTIKTEYALEVCLSAGLINDDHAKRLKEAGLDRLNHNLNTSEKRYEKICTTHTYKDRMDTLLAAQKNNLNICSGMIVGMGETNDEIIEVARKLKEVNAVSIPINFLVPIEGNILSTPENLTPERCLRILCLFRLINPKAEIRMAAGREIHLRTLQTMGLYVANSLFIDGYLNTKGSNQLNTLQMIKDAGFDIKSDQDIETLLAKSSKGNTDIDAKMKAIEDLRPVLNQ